jgi:two-component system NarL family response regulator
MRPIRIVIVDRNDITRKGMEGIIGDAGAPYQVVAAFAHLRDAENYVGGNAVDVVIIDDTTLHVIEVPRLVTRCYETQPGLGIIVMSQRRDGNYVQQIMRYGNAGYILKNGDIPGQLLKAIQMVSEKYPFLSTDAAKLIGIRQVGILTHRDLEVLRLLEQQLSVKEIGTRLDISTKTVYRVRDKVKRALGVRNNEMLVDAARKQGLLERKE